jgi:hypothetical protein
MSSHQSNVNLLNLPKEIWFKIIEICQLDSLYSMYLVNKLFQQRIKNMNLLPPLWIWLVMSHIMYKYILKNPKRTTKFFLSHHKFLQETKHYKLGFLTHEKFLNPFDSPQLISMINMLEIDVNIIHSPQSYQLIFEKVNRFPNIKILSFVNATILPRNLPELCSEIPLRHLNLRDSILSSSMDFSTCSFVKLSLDNMNCRNGISIKMPDCLKKCDLSCYQTKIGLFSNCFVELQMSHCKKLNTL